MFHSLPRKMLKALGIASAIAALSFAAPSANAAKICIDPGHGGSDPGAVGGGQYEKTNVLDKGNKLRDWLNLDTSDGGGGGSWTVIRTRSTDVYVSLSGRTSYANSNGANRFMSIHNNGFSNTSANGMETFCHTSLGTSEDLRNKVQNECLSQWPITNRGNKTANFYVLAYTSMPAELHEAAFITNAGDRVYLGSSTHRNNNAKAQMWAAQRHYGYAQYTPSSYWQTIKDNSSGSFTPGSGWWTSSSTPGYYGSNYHVRGTAATSDVSTWSFTVPSTGSYKVDAWWSAGSNRSTTAPYLIDHNGGTATVNKNQQINGGKWNNLGQWTFGGTDTVRLSCWTTTGYYVIADAIRVRTP